MTTRNFVPRVSGEGSLGTPIKKWGNLYVDNIPKAQEYVNQHNTDENAHKELFKKAGLPVGHEYTIGYKELQAGQIPLLGGKYSKITYPDLWAWIQTHPSYCKTESEWQVLYTATSGRAVPYYADVDKDYFRVPLKTTWTRGASAVDEVGQYLEAGLPNITGVMTHQSGSIKDAREAFYVTDEDGNYYVIAQSGIYKKLGFDASKSNSIYGKSTTVQPPSVIQLWVVQAFGALSNTGNADVANLVRDKANNNMDNITDTGKKVIAKMGMPSKTFETITPNFVNNVMQYTAPANGWLYFYGNVSGSNSAVQITNSNNNWRTRDVGTGSSFSPEVQCPALRGDILTLSYEGTVGSVGFKIKFIYLGGEM